MSFAYPAFLWLLLVVPPGMFLFFWWSRRTRQQLMTQFIQARLLPGLLAGISATREKIRSAALVAAAVCLLLALARPQWGYDLEEVKQRGLDIVVAIDTSKSMLAEDIAPNRLARAKYAALDLMQQAKSDRLGLVAFAGSAYLQCPLTIDDSAFRQSLEALDVNTLPEGGTALADAIETAQQAFKEGDSYKVLVLFSDGEDQDSGALEAAKKAKDAGLIIFTIGIGSAEGELLRIKGENGQSDYVRDESGNVVKSRLNEALLQQIAGPSPQGFYLPLRGANTIDVLYQKGLAPLPKSDSQEKWVKRAREQYHWPLALAILLLIAEMLFPERKRETAPAAAATPAKLALVPAALLLLLLPAAAYGSPSSALREYRSGKYDEALKDFEQAIEKKNDDPRLHFNAGTAAYRGGQFDEAVKHFGQTLGSPDLNLQEQAYYNLGNALYHLGESNPDPGKKTENWEDSLKKYENSLKLNPQDADAKFNHEFVKKRLEELKQQQQQKQDQNKDNKDNQDKNNQDKNQNQKNDQSKSDQQKDSQSQPQQDQKKDSRQQQQQQAKNQSQPKPDQDPSKKDQQPKQSPEKKDQPQPKPEQAKSAAGQQKKDQESGEQPEEAAYAGQMTPQQAKQLLDAQKNDELLLPINRKEKANTPPHPIKDW
jgi:Ca-activated chloride channel homolog